MNTYNDGVNGLFAVARRQEGFNGKKVNVYLSFVRGTILEMTDSGLHQCPVYPNKEENINSAKWLVKNHPEYKRFYSNVHFINTSTP